jgi:methyl-accepting chemotaxis protein
MRQKYPDYTIIALDSPDTADVDVRWESLKKTISEHKDFDCYVCVEAQGYIYAKKIIDELKLQPLTLTFDKTDDSLEFIRQGFLNMIIAQRQGLWGELAVRRLYEALADIRMNDFEDTGTYEINSRNIGVFRK